VFGAAAAAGKLLGLNERRMTWALGIAATQASGLTEMLGSMSKSYNMGHAAKNGFLAALLAERDFTSSSSPLEARRGYLPVTSSEFKLEALTERLGETWELAWNAYKPFPCGIVLHAAIDGCIELRREYALTPTDIESIEVQLHPLALQLAGRLEPTTGLEGKLSVAHAAAVALLRGQADVEEFTDACVRDPNVVSLRRRVRATPEVSLDKAAAVVRIGLVDGRSVERVVPHAIGSLERPMSDGDLETKFRGLASRAYSECHAWDVVELVWSLDRLNDASKLVRATAPET
jgi:2-methylcitrate dehydratase PrpD